MVEERMRKKGEGEHRKVFDDTGSQHLDYHGIKANTPWGEYHAVLAGLSRRQPHALTWFRIVLRLVFSCDAR